MLTNEHIAEIKEHLERAQNPVIFYDNDPDGLCAFLILRRFLGRGKGVAIKSYPGLDAQYARKIEEFNSDYVFVLDKPVISREFAEDVEKKNIPLVWIDHHDVEIGDFSRFTNFHIYNPTKNKTGKSSEPVTYLVHKITNRKEDEWIAVAGCISDRFMPDFAEEFSSLYPEFWGKVKDAFDVLYKTEIGRIIKAFSFGLKDSISHVVQMQNFLLSVKSPNDVFAELHENKNFRERYDNVKKKYDYLFQRAKENTSGKLIFFEYSGDLSISADLANELSYLYPKKYIAVAFRSGGIVNISMRGKKIRNVLEKVLKEFKEASGGGHEDAVGARVIVGDLEGFKKTLENRINEHGNSK